MNGVKIFHVIGERPTSFDVNGRSVEIPEGWLIFNAPRPLYATPFDVVIREEFESGGFHYDESRGEVYPEWRGNFFHGVFYVAVSPDDEDRIERNRSLDGWVLEFHSYEDATLWAVEFYGREYGLSEEKVLSHDVKDYVRNYLDHLNGE